MQFLAINGILDSLVRTIHHPIFSRTKYHPYLFANDLGKISILVAGVVFVVWTQEATVLHFLSAFVLTFLGYRAFVQVKGRLFGMWSRSYLQDLVIFVVPWVLFLSFLFEIPIFTTLDLMGFLLPLYLFFIRLGCFSGGCCYGVPSRLGVFYPDEIFRSVRGLRTFSPGPNPHQRVLPTQLIEAFYNGVIFCIFCGWVILDRPGTSRVLLFLYLSGYGAFRFCLDFFRVSSSRPRIGRFSEAQVVSFFLSLISFGIWLGLR